MLQHIYENSKLKVKLRVRACERKGEHFLYRLFCPQKFFLNICALSQSIVDSINFQNIHTFTYQTTLFYTLF